MIVQQPEDEKAGGNKSGAQDGGGTDDVYDFDGDPDDPNSLGEFITDDKKMKGTGKRSQTVTYYNIFSDKCIALNTKSRSVVSNINFIFRLLKHTCAITVIIQLQNDIFYLGT